MLPAQETAPAEDSRTCLLGLMHFLEPMCHCITCIPLGSRLSSVGLRALLLSKGASQQALPVSSRALASDCTLSQGMPAAARPAGPHHADQQHRPG